MTKRVAAGVFVVGLFGSLLTFASSPVHAEVGTISVPSFDLEGTVYPAWGGTYTATWKAQGGCNPALDGSVTKTFPGGVVGDLFLGTFSTDDNCNYEFEVSYFTVAGAFTVAGQPVAAGVQCAASIHVQGVDGDYATTAVGYVSVDPTDCVETSDLVVTVAGPADPADGSVDNSHHRSAVKARDWLITVTPNGKGSDGSPETAADECAEADGRATDIGRAIPEIRFTLISDGLNAEDGSALSCQYEVSVTLSDGFIKHGETTVTFTPVTGGEGFISFNLKVAEREVYVAQTVRGDSSGGSVEYRGNLSCSGTQPLYLPDVMPGGSGPSSIEVVSAGRLVALEEGRYDVTVGVVGSVTVAGGRSALVSHAVGSSGDPCSFAVSVRGVPTTCEVAETRQVVDLVAAESQSLVEFFYTCSPPPPPVALEPAVEVPPSTSTTAVMTTEPPSEPGPTTEVPTG